jgi:hypothetical protein
MHGTVSETESPCLNLVSNALFESHGTNARAADLALVHIPTLETLTLHAPAHMHAFSIVRALLYQDQAYPLVVRHFVFHLLSLEHQVESTQMEPPAPRCARSLHSTCARSRCAVLRSTLCFPLSWRTRCSRALSCSKLASRPGAQTCCMHCSTWRTALKSFALRYSSRKRLAMAVSRVPRSAGATVKFLCM